MTTRLVALCAVTVMAVAVLQGTFARAQAPAAPAGTAVFPSKVSDKYSKESAGRARMHTCLDQYRANKATNANDGLKWLAKNGYWSQCDKKLKGTS